MVRLAAGLALAVAAAAGCGYRLAGLHTPAGGPHLRVWVAPIDDRASEPLFGAVLARQIARQVADRPGVRLVPRDRADRVLRVRLDRVEEEGAAYRVGDEVREYVLTGSVTVTVTRPDGEVVWRGAGVWADREFSSGPTVQLTEANKDAALDLLARDLAGEILRRLVLAGQGQGG